MVISARGAPFHPGPLCVQYPQRSPKGGASLSSKCSSSLLGAVSQKKSFMEKETESATMIDGLLAIMPVGCRNVTYLPASAVDALAKDTSAQALLHRCHAAVPPPRCLVPDPRRSLARAGIKDYSKLPGAQTYSHGPYLDDWSKVPADIAAKYNTSPTPSFAGK